MRKRLLLLVLLPAMLCSQGATKVASTAASFLKIGVGARAAGMADSFSALATDVTAVYWNPAGLSRLSNYQVFFSHINWLADIGYDFFALGIPIGTSRAIGLFTTSLQVPEDEVRTVLQPEGTGEYFDASDIAIGIAYAQNITDRFSVGFVGKFIQERIWSMTSNTVALDVGTLYESRWKHLRIGIVLSNFGPKMKLSGRANLLPVDPDPTIEGNIETIRAELEMGRWDLPLNLKTSLAMEVISTPVLKVTLAGDMVHPNDNREYINMGGEAQIFNLLYLRAGFRGYGMDQAEGGRAVGGGLHVNISPTLRLNVDYALTDFGRLKNVNQLSIGVGF